MTTTVGIAIIGATMIAAIWAGLRFARPIQRAVSAYQRRLESEARVIERLNERLTERLQMQDVESYAGVEPRTENVPDYSDVLVLLESGLVTIDRDHQYAALRVFKRELESEIARADHAEYEWIGQVKRRASTPARSALDTFEAESRRRSRPQLAGQETRTLQSA